MTAAAVKPPKAPTSHEESTLPCTHICCDSCDYAEPWHASRPAGEWSCPWCGDRSPVFEHWSDRPLGFRDDKACSWGPVLVPPPSTAPPNFRGHVLPEQWVYKGAVPGEPTT